jgi:uncharacterized protein YlxW (UPF0749 family)
MEPEGENEFERELKQAFARRPAPPSLKRKVMEKRRAAQAQRSWMTWQLMAASLLFFAMLAGAGAEWKMREEHRQEEAARTQVLTALRITHRALNQMNTQLAAHGREAQD